MWPVGVLLIINPDVKAWFRLVLRTSEGYSTKTCNYMKWYYNTILPSLADVYDWYFIRTLQAAEQLLR